MDRFWIKWQLWPKNVNTQIFQGLCYFTSTLVSRKDPLFAKDCCLEEGIDFKKGSRRRRYMYENFEDDSDCMEDDDDSDDEEFKTKLMKSYHRSHKIFWIYESQLKM